MRLKDVNPLKWRPAVATTVETVVAMVTTVLVTVFLVAVVVYPEPLHAETARNTAEVAPCTDSATLTA